jgi:hypothetical protein
MTGTPAVSARNLGTQKKAGRKFHREDRENNCSAHQAEWLSVE